jgi:hypothetical protein
MSHLWCDQIGVVALERYQHTRLIHLVARMINHGVLRSLDMEWHREWFYYYYRTGSNTSIPRSWSHMLHVLCVQKASGNPLLFVSLIWPSMHECE